MEGLTNGTTYYFAVAAVDSEGEIIEVAYSSAIPTSLGMEPGNDHDDDDDDEDSPAPAFMTTALAIVAMAALAGHMRRGRR